MSRKIDKMDINTIDTTNMCSHLRRKLFEEEGEYRRLWLALQDDPELTAVVRSRQLHIYRDGKKILVLAGKAAPKIIKEDTLCNLLPDAKKDNPVVRSTELIRTSQSWDGVELPEYLQGSPEIVGVKYEIPAGQKLGWHHHPVMNFGILVQGELTIVSEDGTEKVLHEGEAVVEMVDTIHHGENRGTHPVILYMFYLTQPGRPLSVQHPEIEN